MSASYLDGEIRQDGVGKFYLGWSMDKVIENIDFEYEVKEFKNSIRLENENITFWFWKNKPVLQSIFLQGGYRGKLAKELGIGVAVEEIRDVKYIVPIGDVLFQYKLPEFSGVTFFPDFDKGAEDINIIGFINVYWCGQEIGDETVKDVNWGEERQMCP